VTNEFTLQAGSSDFKKIASSDCANVLAIMRHFRYPRIVMDERPFRIRLPRERLLFLRRLYGLLSPHAHTTLILAALFCTLLVKFFHSWRCNSVREYPGWILSDISVLLGIDVVLSLVCFRRPRKWALRAAIITSAIVCTWSVMNAGWLIRTGTQILPAELLPLLRDPLNALGIVLVNMLRMPEASAILLIPSAFALAFFFCVLARPVAPNYNRKLFTERIIGSAIVVCITAFAHTAVVTHGSTHIISAGLRYNCQSRAVMVFFRPELHHLLAADFANAKRLMPACDQVTVVLKPQHVNHNVVIVVLEGIQYNYTSLAARQNGPGVQIDQPYVGRVDPQHETRTDPTPFLACLARQGTNFTNARSAVTHTTKALFALLTGRVPSASQDIGETVPMEKPYASIATILKSRMNFRTAFFQSAKGTFESRPGLVHNLGFDKFWAREDLDDPNSFVGYLGCDEFAMLTPITEWIQADNRPFLLVVLCSVTHDPYEAPQWFAQPAKEPAEKYRRAVAYTDKFLAALDIELAKLNLTDKTIFCVVGDHGEAFGEHGLRGHERIAFDEVLRIPFCLRAPLLVAPGTEITAPVNSVDLTPTLLAILGFDVATTAQSGFDGDPAIAGPGSLPADRKEYFAGWMEQGPAGYVQGSLKFIHDPTDNTVWLYDLAADPRESLRVNLPKDQAREIADGIIAWRKGTIFRLNQNRTGQKILFDTWRCKWTGRVSTSGYRRVVRD